MFSLLNRWLSGQKRVKRNRKSKRAAAGRRFFSAERLEDRMLLAVTNIFLELSNTFGEPADSIPAMIEIDSFSFGASSGGDNPSSTAGRATTLDFRRAPQRDQNEYLSYELENAFISSYQIGGSSGVPVDSFSINFATIGFEFATGDKQLFVPAQKIGDIEVENDETHWVGRDGVTGQLEMLTVSISRTETVDNNETITIHVQQTETVEADVQYRESDFDFARLIEEEGIYYFYSFGDGNSNAVFACADGNHFPTPLVWPSFAAHEGLLHRFNPAGNTGSPIPSYDWLQHLDRQLVSAVEQYLVSDFSPGQLTQYFSVDPNAEGGVAVATGDLHRDGAADLITARGNFAVKFEQVYVTSYSAGSSEPLPVETFSLNFVALHIPRIGQEVIVNFLEGDPDQPIIVGCQPAEPPPAPKIVSAAMGPALERQLSTLQLAVDPNNPNHELMLSIDWGDGSAPEVFVCPSDPSTFSLAHRYAHDGQFNVKVSLVDADGTIPAQTELSHNVLNVDIVVVGAGPGAGPHVKVFDSNTGELKFSFSPYQGRFRGGVRVATGDVNGDGIPDIITAPGAGKSGGHVKVFDGVTGTLVSSFLPYGGFLGGIFVAAGDMNGDDRDDIITGPDRGAGPHVKAFDVNTTQLISSFFAYAPSFNGGVRVAAGDVNGDGFADIITAPGAGRSGGHVKVFDGTSNTLLSSFLAYPGFSGGVFVAAGDVNGDGRDDIITGPDRGAPPHVKIYSYSANTSTLDASFFAYDANFRGGVRVAAGDVNGDGRDDIITGAAGGVAQKVRLFDGLSLAEIDSFFAFQAKSGNGLFVAGS